MSAQHIFDAPLGSLIAFSNGEPRPPERFRRKLALWEQCNGTGRLTERSPASGNSPASFALHLRDYGSQGVIVMKVRRIYTLDSALHFEIVETPRSGMVRVITSFAGRDELLYLAPVVATAEAWMASHHYSNMRAEIVGDADPAAQPSIQGRAA